MAQFMGESFEDELMIPSLPVDMSDMGEDMGEAPENAGLPTQHAAEEPMPVKAKAKAPKAPKAQATPNPKKAAPKKEAMPAKKAAAPKKVKTGGCKVVKAKQAAAKKAPAKAAPKKPIKRAPLQKLTTADFAIQPQKFATTAAERRALL